MSIPSTKEALPLHDSSVFSPKKQANYAVISRLPPEPADQLYNDDSVD